MQGFLHLFLYLQFKKELFHLRRPIILLLGLYLAAAAFLYIISPKKAESQPVPNSPPDFTRPSALETDSYLIYDESSGDILEVPREKFIPATVALEMDPDSPKEALKAQAIAARSYYDRLRQENIRRDFHFICNSEKGTVWAADTYFRELWGDEYEDAMIKINSAVEESEGIVLKYKGVTAWAPYFPVSCGVTSPDPEFPYLISVASPYDSLSPYFEDSRSFTPEEVEEICRKTWPEGRFDFNMEYEDWFSEIVYSTGTVVYSTNICGFGVTGKEVREAFELASSAFMVEYKDGKFIIHTRGLGHGVGMSQHGAIQMAVNGSSCEEILAWYYPGTVLAGG